MSGRGMQGTNDGGVVVDDGVEKAATWRSKVGGCRMEEATVVR